jgi:hypothetical protein
MCIAIYRPPSRKLPKDTVRRAFQSNHDGAGFAYALNDTIMIYRDPKATFQTFWPAVRDALRGNAKNAPMVVHFRFATHGSITEPNTHPILTHGGRNAIVHNGIIAASPTSKEDDRSDTNLFCTQLIDALPERLDQHPELHPYLSSLIGHSKMVVLHASGAVTFLRAAAGVWHEEIWYSNTAALPYIKPSASVPITTTPLLPITNAEPLHRGSSFRRVGTFDSKRGNLTIKIDGFLSQFGTLYVRTRNRKNGGSFYAPEPVGGTLRMCDACNDALALDYHELSPKCFQRLCLDCTADWEFIWKFLDKPQGTTHQHLFRGRKKNKLRPIEPNQLVTLMKEVDVTPEPPPTDPVITPPSDPLATVIIPGEPS